MAVFENDAQKKSAVDGRIEAVQLDRGVQSSPRLSTSDEAKIKKTKGDTIHSARSR